jgi:hypothetical protein
LDSIFSLFARGYIGRDLQRTFLVAKGVTVCYAARVHKTEKQQMANFQTLNHAIKAKINSDIVAVRGDGYVYFDGEDGFDQIPSLYVHPVNTPTDEMIRLCIEHLNTAIAEVTSHAVI